MDAYIGLETEPGSQDSLYEILKGRKIDAFLTLGAHNMICRLPSFATLGELRRNVDRILFTREKGRPLVENTTSYIIVDHHRKKVNKNPTAFCFIRSGRLPSRDKFDSMVAGVLSVSSVLAVSVVIGLFDLVCEVITKDVAELKATVDQILATPGISPRATMVCIVVATHGARSEDTKKPVS